VNGSNRFFVATCLSVAMFLPSVTQAMEIRQFDKMAKPDQGDYVGVLVGGAEKILTDAGRSDDAAKVEHLFTTRLPGDTHSMGTVEFELNLAILRENDAKNAIQHPNDPRLEVEDAMFVTLKKNNIILPDSFFTVASGFQPKFPQQSKDTAKKDDKKKN